MTTGPSPGCLVETHIENHAMELYHQFGGIMKIQYGVAAVAAVLLLGACATTPPSQDEGKVAAVIELINNGAVEDLSAQSHVPFLFDAELLVRSTDIGLMWSGVRQTGLRIAPVGFVVEPAAASDYARIADTFDLQSYFGPEGYLPDDAAWVTADSSAGRLLVLLGGREGSLPLIYGIARVDR